MTIENSEVTTQVGVTDPAESPPAESPAREASDAAARADAASGVIQTALATATGVHDSTPPMSRKLAPPPKPKRDSGAASAPPSGRPPDGPDLLASASALKAPIPPTIFSAGQGVQTPDNWDTAEAAPSPAEAPNAPASLSQPPPMRRRSNPSIADGGETKASGSARTPSDPVLAADAAFAKETANALRPIASPPRPRSDPPPRLRADSSPSSPLSPESAVPPAPAPSTTQPGFPPPSTSPSAIFAMRIIAVGDSVRAPAAGEHVPELDPNSYPPSASRLGTTVRRSSRPPPAPVVVPAATAAEPAPVPASATAEPAPVPASATAAEPAPVPASVAAPAAELPSEPVPVPVPVAAPVSADTGPTLEFDVHIDVELPEVVGVRSPSDLVAALDAAAAALEASSVEVPSVPVNSPPIPPEARRPPMPPPPVELSGEESAAIPSEARRPPMPPPPVELSGDEFSAEAIAKKIAAAEAVEAAEAARAAARGSEAGEEKPAESGQAAEELGREDAISMPPEEVAALEDAAKPPPPPKRALGTPASAPPAVESPPASSAPTKEPPTPDLAAAKAAQRSKTRQPWWEDLFNEDFMRASSRVSDEHIRREVTFIEESLGVAAGGVVLDLGCGAGHHAVEFASRGYGVVGYDLSLYQLALAADVAQERSQKINFLQGDMREMAFEEMFDGVFCWNTTFGYFEEDKNLAVAQRVFKALRPGGMFLIDVLNRDFAAASAPCTVWYEGDSCVCMDDMSVDYISSRLRVKRSIILDDGRTKESLFSLRLYSLHELGKLLHEVGFRVTEASGHPATPGVFFGPNSPRIIMLAQRP